MKPGIELKSIELRNKITSSTFRPKIPQTRLSQVITKIPEKPKEK